MAGDGDHDGLLPDSDSFWEPGNYKRTTKRITDAGTLCNELVQLIQERGDIEAKYATTLRSWSRKWNTTIDKSPEYGTMAAAWKSALNEADRLAQLHVRMKEKMDTEVITAVRQWQKDNLHKTLIREFKEKKEMDDAFKKAQKPWEKKLREVQKAKHDYHTACQKKRSAELREKNSVKDTSLSVDQKKKIEEEVVKLVEQRQLTREKYEKALRDINEYNPKYMEDMGDVYDKCSEMERQRLVFFKDQLKALHRCLDLSSDEGLRDIYNEFNTTLEAADANKDLRWWSKTCGIDMTMNWPAFEEYQPEKFTKITSKKSSKALASGTGDGVALTGVQYKITEDDALPATVPAVSQAVNQSVVVTQVTAVQITQSAPIPVQTNSLNSVPSPSLEDDWDDDLHSLTDAGDPGIPVRAMYDYEALEEDELTFTRGEVFEKLEDQDDQGWCKGRLHGRVGLFPASYVKDVPGQ